MDTLTKPLVYRLVIVLLSFTVAVATVAAQTDTENSPKLQNPIDVTYLKKHLRKAQPRLVLNRNIEKR